MSALCLSSNIISQWPRVLGVFTSSLCEASNTMDSILQTNFREIHFHIQVHATNTGALLLRPSRHVSSRPPLRPQRNILYSVSIVVSSLPYLGSVEPVAFAPLAAGECDI